MELHENRPRQYDILTLEPDNLKTILDTLSAIFSSAIKTPISYKDTGYNISNSFGRFNLFPHQKALVYHMFQKERSLRTGTTIAGVQLFGRYSILGDKQGTGKTLAALAYIAFCKIHPTPQIAPYLHHTSHNNFFSYLLHPNSLRTNIYVIPNTDIDNMKSLLESQTTLTYTFIKKQNHMSQALIDNMPDLIVIPTSQYNSFCQFAEDNNLIFERCFFENIENIHLYSPQSNICAHFTWLVTHQWFNFIFPFTNLYNYGITLDNAIEDCGHNQEGMKNYIASERTRSNDLTSHIRSVFSRFITTHPLRQKLILRTSDSFLNSSVNPKTIEVRSIKYNHDDRFHVIYPIHSITVFNLIQDNDLHGALESIGAQQIYCQESMKKLCRDNTFDEACPICYDDEVKIKTLTNCCKQIFCANCILSSCSTTRTDKCPLCRQTISGSKLVSLFKTPTASPETNGLHKSSALINYLIKNKEAKSMLYYPNQSRFAKIYSALKSANIHFEQLSGPRNANKSKIEKFNNNRTNLLIVHDIEHLTGHYIPTVSSLILYPNTVSLKEREFLLSKIQCFIRPEPLIVVDFVLEAAATTGTPELQPVAPASPGVINTNLGDSSVATSHT